MLPARVASVPFTVTDASGKVVYRGVSRDDVGAWNAGYQAVYLLTFSGLHRCGSYRVHVGAATSPAFKIANGSALYGNLVDNAVRYFTSERDGADVERGVLQPGARQPHRREGGRLRHPELRRQRQPARHAQEGRPARSTCPAAGSTPAAATRSSATPPATPTR